MIWSYSGNDSVCSAGDATREARFYARRGFKMVGKMSHPDVERWGDEVVYIPETAAALRKLILITRKLDQLGAEVYTEQFRCISNKSLPSVAYTVFSEASNGKSGFLNWKYWFAILEALDGVPLSLECFITDGCSVGISSGKLQTTPTEETNTLGVSYLGLPVDDFKHYACYCRTAIRSDKARLGFTIDDAVVGNMVTRRVYDIPYEVPSPVTYTCDSMHWFRLVRRNADGLAFLVFFTEKLDDLQVSLVCSFDSLR